MRFNIRVYALITNDQSEILLADEEYSGNRFVKFPGGGLEWGEGILDALQREAHEELHQSLIHTEHFYTTEFFQKSAFNAKDQLISIYYKAQLSKPEDLVVGKFPFDFSSGKPAFRWVSLKNLESSSLTFPIDKVVLDKLKESLANH